MFSTSMMASSTTSPSAITRPAITIVLRVNPNAVSTTTAVTSDSGTAVRLMRAVRQSNRKAIRMTTTNPHPISSAWVRLAIARSTNVAGRKMVGSTSTPVSPGSSSLSAASTLRVTSRVFASGCFSTIRSSPGTPSGGTPPAFGLATMIASPMGGGEPNCTFATSPNRTGALPWNATTVRPRSSGFRTTARCRIASRWFGLSMYPPDSSTVASWAARVI